MGVTGMGGRALPPAPPLPLRPAPGCGGACAGAGGGCSGCWLGSVPATAVGEKREAPWLRPSPAVSAASTSESGRPSGAVWAFDSLHAGPRQGCSCWIAR